LYHDAIITYHEDLAKLPKNGWAHHGLKLAYQGLNDSENITKMDEALAKSWEHADFEIH